MNLDTHLMLNRMVFGAGGERQTWGGAYRTAYSSFVEYGEHHAAATFTVAPGHACAGATYRVTLELVADDSAGVSPRG